MNNAKQDAKTAVTMTLPAQVSRQELEAIAKTAKSGNLDDLQELLQQQLLVRLSSVKLVQGRETALSVGSGRYREVRQKVSEPLKMVHQVPKRWTTMKHKRGRGPLGGIDIEIVDGAGGLGRRFQNRKSGVSPERSLSKPKKVLYSGRPPEADIDKAHWLRGVLAVKRVLRSKSELHLEFEDAPGADAPSDPNASDDEVLGALTAQKRWEPTATQIQRAKEAQRAIFMRSDMLDVKRFIELSGRARSSVYGDLGASPARLLGLPFGTKKRIPDCQLQAPALDLVRSVLQAAEGVDPWTVYFALTRKLPGLDGMSPVEAVLADGSEKTIEQASAAACSAMDLH